MAGIILIISLVLTPIILWAPAANFSSFLFAMYSLGQMAALTGGTLFALNFILSARFKLLDKLFNGVNRAYIYHHQVGVTAFILLLSHPLFISFSYGLKIFIPRLDDLPVLWGILAWTLFMSLLIITLFLHLKYHVWKNTHKFLGLALFLAFFHVFLIHSTVSEILALRWYMLGIMSCGLAAFTYRVFLGRYLVPRLKYTVNKVNRLTDQVTEITLAPQTKKLNYVPGQFSFLTIMSPIVTREIHPFSMVSHPTDTNIMFAIKSSGDYTSQLPKLTPGALVKIEGGYGKFTYTEYFNKKQIWIAGGIGITPYMAMIKDLKNNPEYKVNLIYSINDKNEVIYQEILEQKRKELPNFDYQIYESNKSGRITATWCATKIPNIQEFEIFLCGPKKMMTDLRIQFRSLGVRNSHIHSEEFALN
jgi:predicted ferric reductase